jgi:activating signal cointegrator 1
MKALTICNPYPELILIGEKPIENRTWVTSYRGQLFIHAGLSKSWMTPGSFQRFPNLPFGAIVGVCTLVACLELEAQTWWPDAYQHLKGHQHANGPFCWVVTDVKRFKVPVPCRGAQGLWNVPPMVLPLVREQMQVAA